MKPVLWLVEDEPSIADTLVYTLESEGFEVRWFERAEPALQALAQGAPALAILDVGLPDINGFDCVAACWLRRPTCRFCFLPPAVMKWIA